VIGLVSLFVAFVHHGFDLAVDASVRTRREAWSDVREGCASESPLEDVEMGTIDDYFGGLERLPGAATVDAVELFRRQPALSLRLETLAFTIVAHRWSVSGTVERPVVGGEAVYGHGVALVCDERHRETNLGSWIRVAAGVR
jgi:hypothetical protein